MRVKKGLLCSGVEGGDVDNSVCEFLAYIYSEFGCAWWEGLFLSPGWAQPS